MIANSTPIGAYFVRIASVTTSPTSDSHGPPGDCSAGVGARDEPRRVADRRAEDRRELRVQLVDPRLDGRIGRDPDVPRLVEVGRLVDHRLRRWCRSTSRTRVKRMPLLRFSVDQHAVRPRREHLEVGVVADHRVDVRDVVGQVEERSGRVRSACRRSRRGGRSRRSRRCPGSASLAASALTAAERVRDVERRERVRETSVGASSLVKPTTPILTPSNVEHRRGLPLRRRLAIGVDDVRGEVRELAPAGSACCAGTPGPCRSCGCRARRASKPIRFMISIVGVSPKKAEIGGVAPTESPRGDRERAVRRLGAVGVEPRLQEGRAADREGRIDGRRRRGCPRPRRAGSAGRGSR